MTIEEPGDTTPVEEMPPPPTYVPAAMAMAVTLSVWGILTHWSMSIVGVGLFVWALYQWMCEVCAVWRLEDGG